MTMSIQSPHWNSLFQRLSLLAIIFSALMLNIGTARAHTSPPSRPVLFVHGFLGDSSDWGPSNDPSTFRGFLTNALAITNSSEYANTTNYDLYFDNYNGVVRHSIYGDPTRDPPAIGNVPSNARFFSIRFYSWNSSAPFDAIGVANISIVNKAYELSRVVAAITQITGVDDAIVVAHSQGGLVARSYIEGLGSSSLCLDTTYSCLSFGSVPYNHDIAHVVSIDTPYGGADFTSFLSALAALASVHYGYTPINVIELAPGSSVLQAINYQSSLGKVTPRAIPSTTTIDSIESYLGDLAYTCPNGSGQCFSDDVVTSTSQAIRENINPSYLSPGLTDDGNPISSTDSQVEALEANVRTATILGIPVLQGLCPVPLPGSRFPNGQGTLLHFLSCTGAITYTQDKAFNSILPYLQGQLSGSNIPTVTTLPATLIGNDGANLNGTVNPNGSAATAWFEYGTGSTLQTFQKTTVQSIPSGISSVPLIYGLSGRLANTTYYFRSAASNGTATVRDTNIRGFTTLNTLPPPTLLTPANSSTGSSLTPQLSWTAVQGATSGYRVMMSTSMSSLPTDPNLDACGEGCVLGSTGATTSRTTFSPPAGALSSSTTYYWEVHGRSPTQAGTWSSPIWSFTTGSAVSNDFSISVSPSSQSVTQGSSASYNVVTATSSGTSQNITLGASNVPSGLTATFSPATLASGAQATLTVAASSSVPTGTYTLTITGTGASATHTYQISVTVAQAQQSTPVASVNPGNVQFSDQTVGSISSPKTVVLTNTGTARLALSGIGPASGNSDYALSWPPFTPPLILPPGGSLSIQVWFEPRATGLRTGQIIFYDNAPGSPQVVSLTGNGLATQPSTGTVNVNATLNGVALPAAYSYQYSMTGPTSITGYDNNSFSVTPGSYSIAFQNNPSNFALSSVTPSASQTVAVGGTTTFTLNFTAPNDFQAPFFGVPQGAIGPQVITAGQSAIYYAEDPPLPGNASAPITLSVTGAPPGAIATFNPQPSYGSSTLTVSTDASSTPAGVYSLTLSGSNSSGLTHVGAASTLAVITPPVTPVLLVSQSSTGVQGNWASSLSSGSVSGDGRVVAFSSTSTNLVASDTSGHSKVLIRDLQSGTTSLASLSTSGVPADQDSGNGSISANGQYVVFVSGADNLYPGSALSTSSGVYVRDLANNLTEREDVAQDGTPANGNSNYGAISADGRFVAFISNATNLVSDVSGTQAYLRDRKTGQTTLISTAIDGSAGNGYSTQAAISADGRYVGFVSSATNLVSQNTNGLNEAFVRDTKENITSLVSISSDGQPANTSVDSVGLLGISADGRYVVFASSATNLAPHPTDYATHVFLYDCQLQQTTLVDVDSVGTPLGGGSFYDPAISADGRFVVFFGFAQEFVHDAVESQTAVVSVAPDGQPDNNTSGDGNSYLGLGGSRVAFASFGTNLVTNDTNGQADAFVASNPFVGNVSLNSVSLGSAFVPGGNGVTGTVTLTGAAPTGGAVVSVWSNNTAGQAPGTVTVPAGATSAQFSVNTSMVDAETAMTIMASYNGGSNVAVLTLEPASELAVSPSTWDFGYQAVGTTSAIESFVLTNSGTAPLAINSVQLATGQVFKFSANSCGSSIAAGGSCSVSVAFGPSSSGSASDAVQISYGSPATTFSISLTGNGTIPVAALTPAPLSFGYQSMPGSATEVATLTNNGNASLSSIAASISGTNAGDFSISSDGCSGVVLPANSNCLVTVSFSPKAKGSRAATLSIADSASGSPQTISLTGTGVQSTPTLLWSPSAASITYGTPLGTGVLDATANQSGSNLAGTFAYTATRNGGTPQVVTQATVLGAGMYALTATFTPADATDYTTATATISITINPATPTMTVSLSASNITTAQTLTVTVGVSGGTGSLTPTGSVTLSGGGYTSTATTLNGGSATINIPAGSLATGADTLTASYTPDSSSSSTYNSATGSTSVTVTTTVSASFTVSGTAVTVAKGATTTNTSTITVTPAGGFTGSVALTAAVTSSPAGAQYLPTLSFGSTTPVGITGTTAGTATLTISTTAATSAALVHPKRPGVPWYAAGGATLACLLLFGIPARRRSGWQTMLGMLALLFALAGGLLACGGGGSSGGGGGGGSISGTTSGAYTVTITGTSGTTTATGTVILTVQ